MTYIKIENLNVIFGTKKEQVEALKLLNTNKTIEEIKELTNATVASRNLNFEIKKNEMLVIVGLSGSGKSSFVRTLNLLNKPTSGNIYVNNKNITKFNKEELREYRRKEISMVFQAFGLLNHRNILDNVSFPLEIQNISKKVREQKALKAIELVSLKGWEESYPHELSGGMQQRVGLARALANEPNIILLDEPFSALDPLIRKEMQDDLLTLADKTDRTTIFITHDMTEAFKLGDRVVLMKDGEIVQIGTPKEFFRNPKNDYVKQFLEDVDKTKILRVRNVMRKINNLVMIEDSLKDVYKHMNEKEIEDLFVTDDKGVLLGYVNKNLVKNNLDKKLTDLKLKKITHYLNRNTYLTDVFNDLNDSDIEVPVLDSKGRLRGVIGYSDVIDALSD